MSIARSKQRAAPARSEKLPDEIAVFDAGVWFSAIQFGGIPLAAIKRAFVGGLIACSSEIRAETESNLERKCDWNPRTVRTFMDRYLRETPDTPITGQIHGICRDINDDHVLECAFNSNARFLVSGDKDLLVLNGVFRFEILTPREYLGLDRFAPTRGLASVR